MNLILSKKYYCSLYLCFGSRKDDMVPSPKCKQKDEKGCEIQNNLYCISFLLYLRFALVVNNVNISNRTLCPLKYKNQEKIVNYTQNGSVTSLTVRNPGSFCLRDVMIKLLFFCYMVWFIYHLYSIFREIILKEKKKSLPIPLDPCLSPTPLSKLLTGFGYSTVPF